MQDSTDGGEVETHIELKVAFMVDKCCLITVVSSASPWVGVSRFAAILFWE